MSIQVTYETNHISLLRDSTMSDTLNFCFYVFYCNLEEQDHIRRIINRKKRNIREISIIIIIIILIYQKLGSVVPVQQKIKLPSPNPCFYGTAQILDC